MQNPQRIKNFVGFKDINPKQVSLYRFYKGGKDGITAIVRFMEYAVK